MSAFEDFVQLELPKRPYLNADVAQETVLVRRGAGPRQMGAVALTEGQVLAMIDGTLKGVSINDPGVTGANGLIRKFTSTVTIADDEWVLNHGLDSVEAIVQVVDGDGFVIIPDEIEFTDEDTITIFFNSPATGTARAIFLD